MSVAADAGLIPRPCINPILKPPSVPFPDHVLIPFPGHGQSHSQATVRPENETTTMYAPPRQRERGTRWQLHSDLLLAAVVVAPPSSSSPPPPLAPHEDAPGEPT